MDNDMKITSKFNEGDTVWFFEQGRVKFMEGVINAINSWDKWGGFRYEIKHINSDGNQQMYNAEEKNMFTSKNEVLENLFEENGTPSQQSSAQAPAPAAV